MQIVIIKRLGHRKFYISNKKEFGFIGGNPSSHKGWMSRYFFVKRISRRESPWDCDMSRRDDAYTLPPPMPEQKPDQAKFLEAIPSGPDSLDFIRRLITDRDYDQVKRTPDLKVFETAGLHFMQSLVWLGEASSRFSRAHEEVITTKRSMDGVLGRHEASMKQFEEIQAKKDEEKESLQGELGLSRAEVQALRAQVQTLETQVQSLEARAQHSEEESKIHQAEMEKLKRRGQTPGSLKRKNFKILGFRDNGYSEEEHPVSFLDVEKALVDMPEDPEEDSSDPDGAPPA
ncbi:filament-like plant protein [Dorcoceras hygrometricum]|uniref:Filament-like plant protein n=1 Tax=Dorcoceras hygrometricum TaxID=472368 RepID=A0A2Z7ARG3_9LAMI|nr:filament-like plant protein [Dorcoceras hygrometricum]